MKRRHNNFTLVEMLTVIAIIGILAGLVIPTVIIAKNRGQVTQAKTDISSIMTALKQVKTDYSRILIKDGSNYYAGDQEINSVEFKCGTSGHSHSVCQFPTLKDNLEEIKDGKTNSYDALIAELSVPKNKTLLANDINKKHLFNRRKKVYLDPKNGFDPTAEYTTDANKEKLYRDPWGNPYTIYINPTSGSEIGIPGTKSPDGNYNLTTVNDIAIYSWGPNGTNDCGCNVELESCIKSGDSDNHKNHDDIASWNL